jgi:hypothetical protein
VYQDNDDDYQHIPDEEVAIREPDSTHTPAYTQDETSHREPPIEINDAWSIGQRARDTAIATQQESHHAQTPDGMLIQSLLTHENLTSLPS